MCHESFYELQSGFLSASQNKHGNAYGRAFEKVIVDPEMLWLKRDSPDLGREGWPFSCEGQACCLCCREHHQAYG